MSDLKKYAVVGDHVVYGGPKNYKREIVFKKNLSLFDAMDFLSQRGIKANDLNIIYKGLEDNMGCYHRYELLEDCSPKSIIDNLSHAEKIELIESALSWINNEQCIPSPLGLKLIRYDNNRLDCYLGDEND